MEKAVEIPEGERGKWQDLQIDFWCGAREGEAQKQMMVCQHSKQGRSVFVHLFVFAARQ